MEKQQLIDWSWYQEKASRTFAEGLGDLMKDNIHMTMGMSTEANELLDIFKKQLAYSKLPDMVNAKEEIGDLMWYVANFCRINNIDLMDALQINIKKLEARYPGKFSNEKAINRDLDAERRILENKVENL